MDLSQSPCSADLTCMVSARPRGEARAYAYADPFGPGPRSMPIWLDDLACDGKELDIAVCRHGGWGNHNCNHDEDAGVSCLDTNVTTTTTTLVNTTTTTPPHRIC